MTSNPKFVSGGTVDKPIERDDEWKKAQEEIEAAHLRKIKEGQHHGGQSLYEVLQANKAAKQDAFEESIRLKNQFRSLDEDEVDFLDKVLASTRAKEAAVKQETAEQLDAFRKQQAEAEKVAIAQEDPAVIAPVEEEQWVAGRKRKKGKEVAEGKIKGLKLRKTSSAGSPAAEVKEEKGKGKEVAATATSVSPVPMQQPPQKTESKPSPPKAVALGLGDYSSDED